MKKFFSLAILATLLSFASFAQAATIAPTWKYEFSNTFPWEGNTGSEGTNANVSNTNGSGNWNPNDSNYYNGQDFISSISMTTDSYLQHGDFTTTLSVFIDDETRVDLSMDFSITFAGLTTTITLTNSENSFAWITDANGMKYQIGLHQDFITSTDNTITFVGNDALKFDLNYSAFIEGPIEPSPTPEPATMLLMGAGLAGLGALRRRRNK